MMRKSLLLTILSLSLTILFAQEEEINRVPQRPLNSIGINLYGYESVISMNYERLFPIGTKAIISGMIGIGYSESFRICTSGICTNIQAKYVTIPHHLTANFGKQKHFLEIGAGGTVFNDKSTQPYLISPLIGYRFLPLEANKFAFRIFAQLSPAESDSDHRWRIPVSMNFGWIF